MTAAWSDQQPRLMNLPGTYQTQRGGAQLDLRRHSMQGRCILSADNTDRRSCDTWQQRASATSRAQMAMSEPLTMSNMSLVAATCAGHSASRMLACCVPSM